VGLGEQQSQESDLKGKVELANHRAGKPQPVSDNLGPHGNAHSHLSLSLSLIFLFILYVRFCVKLMISLARDMI
jgi:hypothetical protein